MWCGNCNKEYFSHDNCPYCERKDSRIRCIDCKHSHCFRPYKLCDCMLTGVIGLVADSLWTCDNYKEK